jgi:hypothetical protein
MKPFTTSAQKTINLEAGEALQKLDSRLSNLEQVSFEKTAVPFIRKATMKDGSTLVAASFVKDNGGTLAMIDQEDVPGGVDRLQLQKKWKDILEDIFPDN